ncbi:hypothetical protein HMPREF1051_1393 [Neisseria sicca VK64]|jgi:hypothetical protein|uniref:Uncharacterized protein n=1 Tax=Neisseria sicca VK64 TaxID=1095748 RepID=I2NNI6_NEISI|nr:hypothetical protein HMPREF1051_1393 [Neisseria sicca VK64]
MKKKRESNKKNTANFKQNTELEANIASKFTSFVIFLFE